MTAAKIGARQMAKSLEKGEFRKLLGQLDEKFDKRWFSSKTRAWLVRYLERSERKAK